MIKEFKSNGKSYLAVEVPKDGVFKILGIDKTMEVLHPSIVWYFYRSDEHKKQALPKGDYKIIGRTDSLTEEQMKEIVQYGGTSKFEAQESKRLSDVLKQ